MLMVTPFERSPVPSLPMYMATLQWSANLNSVRYRDTREAKKLYNLSTEIAIHPNKSGRIIINLPGMGGSREGYNDKYVTLARHMQADTLGAVVRTRLGLVEGFTWDTTLRRILEYTHQNAQEICGVGDPNNLEIYLMGVSTGPSAIAMVAADYQAIKRVLLLNPAMEDRLPEVRTAVERGMERFTGEVYIVMGANDTIAERGGEDYYKAATQASRREIVVIPNCDHQFTGTTNGRIFSQAPYWAFARGEIHQFPSSNPNAGIVLY